MQSPVRIPAPLARGKTDLPAMMLQVVGAFSCKAAIRRGTNLLTQNIFLLPLITATSSRRSNLAICFGSSVAWTHYSERTCALMMPWSDRDLAMIRILDPLVPYILIFLGALVIMLWGGLQTP